MTLDAKKFQRQRGNAALEVMLILPTILLILMLLINMGYNGMRHRQTQAGLRLGAFSYVDGLAAMDKNASKQSAQNMINQNLFPGGNNPATLFVSGGTNAPTGLGDSKDLLAGVSYRQTVKISAKRTPPYSILPSTPLEGTLTLAANTFTYCEMKDEDFAGAAMSTMQTTTLVGGYFLWLFGGCGGNALDFSCKDKCT